MEKEATIYERLSEARLLIAKKGMKKNGKNSFAGYTYFELSDILPAVNDVNKECGIVSVFNFGEKVAELEIIKASNPQEFITFKFAYSPDGASLKGCHKVQNDGAVQTYVKRYLYQNAYEIAEGDALDSTMNPNESPMKPKKKSFVDVISEFPKEKVNTALGSFGYERIEDIPKDKQAQFYNRLKDT